MKYCLEKVLLTKQQIDEKVKEIALKISADYKDKQVLLVGVLKGSVVFLADLMRELNIPCEIDFVIVSSYGSSSIFSASLFSLSCNLSSFFSYHEAKSAFCFFIKFKITSPAPPK